MNDEAEMIDALLAKGYRVLYPPQPAVCVHVNKWGVSGVTAAGRDYTDWYCPDCQKCGRQFHVVVRWRPNQSASEL